MSVVAFCVCALLLSTTLVEARSTGANNNDGSLRGGASRGNRKLGTLTTVELVHTPQTIVMPLKLRAVNVVNLHSLGLPTTAKFNINVLRTDLGVGSVFFSNGRQESSLPWAYCGNVGAVFNECPDLILGATVNITMTPYSLPSLTGIVLPETWTVIQIVNVVKPAPSQCTIPKIGTWTGGVTHFPVAEAQGAMIGKWHVIVGGFLAGYNSVSTQTHVLDTSNATAIWQRMDDYPFPIGITHGAFVVVGTKFYICGGYAGGGIGMHTDICMVYDHSQPPGKGLQWSKFTPLPNGGRAGGGMVYDRTLNALIFSAGSTRPIAQHRSALDHNNTWMYSLGAPSSGWVARAAMPFFANHMSSVTAIDATGKQRHYFSGGQKEEDEHNGNQAEHFEYDAVKNVWTKRKFMTIARSHAASSTRAIGCGFIMVAGCTNNGVRIADISYYDIPTDTWTKIGDLPVPINTPVCDISNGILFCDTGWDQGRFAARASITAGSALPPLPAPTVAPKALATAAPKTLTKAPKAPTVAPKAPAKAPKAPTVAPKAPTKAPKAPTAAPKALPAPVTAPKAPTAAPKALPAPVAAPKALFPAPVPAPVKLPVAAPTTAPAKPLPTTEKRQCFMPKLDGNWESSETHYPVAEAQGATIGKFQVIVGGFLAGYNSVSTQTHILDTTDPAAKWQRMDDYPFPIGITHGAFVVVGTKFYICGGYAGGGIGMHTDVCMVYDNSKPPGRGMQWSKFAPIPNGGRAGGGMVYDRTLNSLIFAAGATRPIAQHRSALDHNNTWIYNLGNPMAGWVARAPMPFMANHMSSVTAMDDFGRERHYFTGGQKQEDEHDGNQAEHFEYDAIKDVWIKRRFMTIPRSHAASSTRPFGCGFIVIAGCTNAGVRLSDISYYDVPTDSWHKVGDLPVPINTPVCDISPSGMLVCNTGWDQGLFAKRIKLSSGLPVPTFPIPNPMPVAPPVKAPAPVQAPVPFQRCTVPKLIGSWQPGKKHPFPVAEAQGAMIGKWQLVVGGFLAGYNTVSTQTHVLDTSNPAATWQRMDDYPFAQGVTHGAFVVVGTKFYMCGGYAGGGIGMHTDVCMVYDNSQPKGQGKQWTKFAPIPNGGRAGGGMVYDTMLDSLIFSAGATRPIPQHRSALDHNSTWIYSLRNPSAGWVARAPMPFFANHMSSVTARDATGRERHYFTGGQKQEDEHDGNQAEHFEYDAQKNVWIKRKFMNIPRSHAASSTRAIGCGFIMVAGCTNAGQRISDISYYDAVADTWTKVGDLSDPINTPVCGIHGGILGCTTGWDSGDFAVQIGITA